MSKDSSATHLHMHHPRLADHFEDFTRPHTSHSNNPNTTSSGTNSANINTGATGPSTHLYHNHTVTYGSSSPTLLPSFLPIEDIYVPPQYQPPNPEDEDDVVPDQHAAFGITRAMERKRESVWRDLGMEGLVASGGRSAGGRVRVRGSGKLMGGRRAVGLR